MMSGLPVTTPGTLRPCVIEYVSIIHAMGLLVSPEIRGRDVQVRSDERHDLSGIATRHAFALT